jgi:hypothetical protein
MRQETIFMIVADGTKKDERLVSPFLESTLTANSTSLTVFILGQIIVFPLAFAAERIAAMLMAYNLYVPIALGLMSILISWSIIWFMPFEVIRPSAVDVPNLDGQQEQATGENEQAAVEQNSLQNIILQNKKSFKVLCLSPGIFFLTCTFWVTSTFGQLMAGTVFLQYIEKKLGYDMADVSNPSHYNFLCFFANVSNALGLQDSL